MSFFSPELACSPQWAWTPPSYESSGLHRTCTDKLRTDESQTRSVVYLTNRCTRQPTDFPSRPTGFFPQTNCFSLQICHRPHLVSRPGRVQTVLFRKRTTDRVFRLPGRVLSLLLPTSLPAKYICIAGVTCSLHDLVTLCWWWNIRNWFFSVSFHVYTLYRSGAVTYIFPTPIGCFSKPTGSLNTAKKL